MKLKHLVICALALVCALPLSAKSKKVAIVAHRGYWESESAGGAHNSIASLKAAQDLGFWGSEFDVNMTRDGVLLVFHDGSVNGMRFIEHDAADFADVRLSNGEKIPTLDEYLDQFEKNKKTRLVFELKVHPEEYEEIAVDKCIAALKAHGLYNRKQVMFISFSLNACALFAEKCPGFTVQYLDKKPDPDEVYARGVNGIDTNYKVFYKDSEWYTKARSHGMSVNCWTVNSEKDMRAMIEMGADYITTNKPEKLRALLEEMGVKEVKAGKNLKPASK